jgi:hypothetical protein
MNDGDDHSCIYFPFFLSFVGIVITFSGSDHLPSSCHAHTCNTHICLPYPPSLPPPPHLSFSSWPLLNPSLVHFFHCGARILSSYPLHAFTLYLLYSMYSRLTRSVCKDPAIASREVCPSFCRLAVASPI